MKKVILTLALASIAMLSCKSPNQKSSSTSVESIQNNWTQNQKETILMISKSSANSNQNVNISSHAQEIAQKTLEECIKEYPNYSDFSYTRKYWYDIYHKVSNQYL